MPQRLLAIVEPLLAQADAEAWLLPLATHNRGEHRAWRIITCNWERNKLNQRESKESDQRIRLSWIQSHSRPQEPRRLHSCWEESEILPRSSHTLIKLRETCVHNKLGRTKPKRAANVNSQFCRWTWIPFSSSLSLISSDDLSWNQFSSLLCSWPRGFISAWLARIFTSLREPPGTVLNKESGPSGCWSEVGEKLLIRRKTFQGISCWESACSWTDWGDIPCFEKSVNFLPRMIAYITMKRSLHGYVQFWIEKHENCSMLALASIRLVSYLQASTFSWMAPQSQPHLAWCYAAPTLWPFSIIPRIQPAYMLIKVLLKFVWFLGCDGIFLLPSWIEIPSEKRVCLLCVLF